MEKRNATTEPNDVDTCCQVVKKMSANKENNLVQAYIELNKFCQSGDYERALKATGKSKTPQIFNLHAKMLRN